MPVLYTCILYMNNLSRTSVISMYWSDHQPMIQFVTFSLLMFLQPVVGFIGCITDLTTLYILLALASVFPLFPQCIKLKCLPYLW